MSPSARDIRAYYDSFLQDRMLEYRIRPNRRIEKAIQFFCSSIRSDDVVLDIGCGIGIATEAMARQARHVVGVDISDQNIWYAKKTVDLPNVSFHSVDVTEEGSNWQALLPSPPTVVTLCDVIEHIPEDRRRDLFGAIAAGGTESLRILLTFPSEFYQRYLAEQEPGELQIIDHTITAQQLALEAGTAGLSISCFRLVDVWRLGQYAHCRLERDKSLAADVRRKPNIRSTIGKNVVRKAGKFARKIVEQRRRKRYIDDVFRA